MIKDGETVLGPSSCSLSLSLSRASLDWSNVSLKWHKHNCVFWLSRKFCLIISIPYSPTCNFQFSFGGLEIKFSKVFICLASFFFLDPQSSMKIQTHTENDRCTTTTRGLSLISGYLGEFVISILCDSMKEWVYVLNIQVCPPFLLSCLLLDQPLFFSLPTSSSWGWAVPHPKAGQPQW